MLPLFVISSLMAVIAGGAIHGAEQGPAFCNNLDCPKYDTIRTYKEGYELRRYEQSKWVATNVSAIEFTKEINMRMFYKLFHYISGNNTKHMKIPMTSPVLTNITHGAGPDCESLYEMHFMIPFDLQEDTPIPADKTVYISTIPSLDVYIKSFAGFAEQPDYVKAAGELADDIDDNSKFYTAFYMTAGYDGPEKFTNRHNEAWLVAKTD